MSLDIDWSLLHDTALSDAVVDIFNRYLATAPRPAFLGPVQVSSFDFGSQAPDVEVVGLGDVYPDFLVEDELEADEHDAAAEDDGGRWGDDMSSAAGGIRSGSRDWSQPGGGGGGGSFFSPHQHHVAEGYAGFNGQGMANDDAFSAFGGRARSSISAAAAARSSFASPLLPSRPFFSPAVYAKHSPFPSRVGLGSALPTPMQTPFLSRNPSYSSLPRFGAVPSRGGSPSSHLGAHDLCPPDERPPPPKPKASGPPSLQLHLRIRHAADVRLALQTTLLINHPSPAFMSLPLALTVTAVELDLHVVVAYQAESDAPPLSSIAASRSAPAPGRRVHISILDPLDPYGPPAPGADSPPPAPHLGESKTPPAGERLIPGMSIESSIGQEGERVLRNVAKVERFILNLIRKMVVDELVFPNFQTLAL